MFYERYLNKKIRLFAPHEFTGLWLRGLGKNPGNTVSSASATGDLMQTFRNPSTSLDAATASLETMVASLHSGTSDKARLQDDFRERSLGKQALRWYLQSDAHNRFDLSLYPMFFKLLSHSMIAERQEDFLWGLLRAEDPMKSTDGGSQAKWKASLLRHMVEANSYWADDSESFSNAHRCFRRAFTDRVSKANYIPKTRAGEYLQSFICKTQSKYLPLDAFDEFTDTIYFFSSSPFHREFRTSRLHLFHPRNPNPEPAIVLLRKVDGQKTRSADVRIIMGQFGSAQGASMLFIFIIRLAQILNGQHRVQDARWVLDFGRKEMPDYFKPGGNPYSNVKPSDLPPIRCKATSLEISRGVLVDDEGYKEISEKTMEYEKARRAADDGQWLPIHEKTGYGESD